MFIDREREVHCCFFMLLSATHQQSVQLHSNCTTINHILKYCEMSYSVFYLLLLSKVAESHYCTTNAAAVCVTCDGLISNKLSNILLFWLSFQGWMCWTENNNKNIIAITEAYDHYYSYVTAAAALTLLYTFYYYYQSLCTYYQMHTKKNTP